IACKPPSKRKNQVLSESEAEVRRRFSFATAYARWAMQNDPVKVVYDAKARRGRTAYKLAFNDAYNSPTINWIDTSGYKGEPKDVLRIRAMDDFKVTGVKICIYSPDSMLLEVGDAQESGNGLDWIYMVTEANPHVASSTIHAI